MQYLRQSTASQAVLIGPFVDDTDGNTAETGLTIDAADIRLSKNGANIVGKNSGGGTHDELGYYTITFDATDTDTVGRLQVMVHESGALAVYHEFHVLEENVFDMLFANNGDLGTTIDAILEDTGTTIPGTITTIDNEIAVIDGIVDDILVDTAEIGAAGAGLTEAGGTGDHLTALATAAALATVDNEIAVIDGIVDDILVDTAEIGAAGAGLTALATQASVNDLPTNAELATALGTLNDLSAAEVNAEVDTALADIHLDHLLAVTYDPASQPGAADALLNELIESDAGVSRFTVNALENAPSGSGASAETIADAVWDEILSGHTDSGSAGEALAAAGTAGDPWTTALPGAYGAGTAGKIIGDNINATISSRATQSSVDTIDGNVDLILEDTGTTLPAALTTIDTEVGVIDGIVNAILVDTDTTIPALIAVVDGNVDSILEDTGTTLPGTLATIDGIVDSILEDTGTTIPATITTIDTVVDSILVDTAEIGVAGAGLTAVPWNASWDAEVQSEATDALNAYDPPTRAEATADKDEVIASVAALNDFDPATEEVDADIRKINGTTVTGNGTAGTPWGPA